MKLECQGHPPRRPTSCAVQTSRSQASMVVFDRGERWSFQDYDLRVTGSMGGWQNMRSESSEERTTMIQQELIRQ